MSQAEAQGRLQKRPALAWNRHELAGAFGDLGTDLPLLLGMILAAGLPASSVLVVFGGLQIVTGVLYRLPMPVQPLKAMAAIVIAQGVTPGVLFGGGVAVGFFMLALATTGCLDMLVRWLPKAVVRGIQLGLGLQLANVALFKLLPAGGATGVALGLVAFLLVLALKGNRRVPAALPVVGLGVAYTLLFEAEADALLRGFGLGLPQFRSLTWGDVVTGALLLGLPQLPLSVANSVIATRQLVEDFFPGRLITARKIGLTYAAMNLVAPWLGGVPVCHGSGGLAGHYAFGGRTGSSVIVYGALFLLLGLFWGAGFEQFASVFPLPVLGVLLFFEALALMGRIGDMVQHRPSLFTTLLVGALCAALPYGYVLGMIVGSLVARIGGNRSRKKHQGS